MTERNRILREKIVGRRRGSTGSAGQSAGGENGSISGHFCFRRNGAGVRRRRFSAATSQVYVFGLEIFVEMQSERPIAEDELLLVAHEVGPGGVGGDAERSRIRNSVADEVVQDRGGNHGEDSRWTGSVKALAGWRGKGDLREERGWGGGK